MIARHDGLVVLVSGAIPGERVRAAVERVGRGVAYAKVVDVLEADRDRRSTREDGTCGGNVYAHVVYERQLSLKGEIVRDAFARIGRLPLEQTVEIAASPETGYRMRARFHGRGGRFGFFREGTHDLCDPATTGQLLPHTVETIERLWSAVRGTPLGEAIAFELNENVPATERAVHFELAAGMPALHPARLVRVDGVTGLSVAQPERGGTLLATGQSHVIDELAIPAASSGETSVLVRLQRDARSFFQGNRYLLIPFVRTVLSDVPPGPVVDLYAGVGLFAVCLAARGFGPVIAVEGDRTSGADLRVNVEPYAERLRAAYLPVEAFLRDRSLPRDATFIVDPPRTGMSREAVQAIVALHPPRIVYVSCDVATLARDVRMLVTGGYELESVRGFDLFPNTAHVETVVVLIRSGGMRLI